MRSAVVCLFIFGGCSFAPHAASQTIDPDGGSGDGSNPIGSNGSNGSAGACATPGSLRDDFSVAMLPSWNQFVTGTGKITVGGGMITLKSGDTNSSADVISKHAVNLVGAAVTVEVPMVFPTAMPGEAGLFLGPDFTHFMAIEEAAGTLTVKIDDGGPTTMVTATYSATAMKWWRIREAAGMVNFETSPDGTTWTGVGSPMADPRWVADVHISLVGSGGNGMAQFAALDTALTATPWCKVADLHDTFSTGDEQWTSLPIFTNPQPCSYSIANNAAVLSQTQAATCFFGSSYAWDLTDGQVVIGWVSAVGTSPQFLPMVELASDTMTVGLFMDGSHACFPDTMASHCTTSYAFAPAGQDKFWRISEATATHRLTFDSSPDGTTWTPILADQAEPFVPSAVEIRLGAMQAITAGDSVTFGSVN
jgi:hypothetical protein